MSGRRALADDALLKAFLAADEGPVFDATLTPLSQQGNIIVTYNWLYSALNCSGSADFLWTVSKLDDSRVTLSPTERYQNMKLYASVRPDWSYFVQVQAPFSADWIVAASTDEFLGFEPQQLTIAAFKGLNGQYLAPNASATSQGGHTGFKIQSNVGSLGTSAKWFMGIQTLHQEDLDLPLVHELTDADLVAVLATGDLESDAAAVAAFRRLIGQESEPAGGSGP